MFEMERSYDTNLRPATVSTSKIILWLKEAIQHRDRQSGCWEWPFGKGGKYGSVRYNSKTNRPHVLALVFDGKPNPDNKYALHTCDNPICVNPSHLYWGTHLQNIQDMNSRGRGNVEAAHKAVRKLTDREVKDIRVRYLNGETQKLLGPEFGISCNGVSRLVNRKTYKDII